ncbi:MAG: hypothetical protein ACOY46_16515 [Bacillota bacterium]
MSGLSGKLIFLSGAINLGFAAFHLMFWRVFDWSAELSSLSADNSAIMQVLNLAIVFILMVAAYMAFFHRDDLVRTPLGRTLLVSWSLFWLLRGVNQIIFWGHSMQSITLAGVFILLFAINAAPLYGKKNN